MMNELEINNQLLKENLFDLFKLQLQKDFQGSGLSSDFAINLPSDFLAMKTVIMKELEQVMAGNLSSLQALLYRVDISESQLQSYRKKDSTRFYPDLLAELIIKRVLQKVILKKR